VNRIHYISPPHNNKTLRRAIGVVSGSLPSIGSNYNFIGGILCIHVKHMHFSVLDHLLSQKAA